MLMVTNVKKYFAQNLRQGDKGKCQSDVQE